MLTVNNKVIHILWIVCG